MIIASAPHACVCWPSRRFQEGASTIQGLFSRTSVERQVRDRIRGCTRWDGEERKFYPRWLVCMRLLTAP